MLAERAKTATRQTFPCYFLGFVSGMVGALIAAMRRYQDFRAWQLAHELNTKVFEMTSKAPACRDFKFRDNIRDAADSAQRNFPEGFGRFAPGLRALSRSCKSVSTGDQK
jgi:hypothetical protein